MPFSKGRVQPPSVPRANVRLADVLARLSEDGRDFDEDWLRRVFDYAAKAHEGQKRVSGEPYVSHPLHVAWILADLKLDPTCVAVALLHDVLEDTGATREDLAEAFGSELAAGRGSGEAPGAWRERWQARSD